MPDVRYSIYCPYEQGTENTLTSLVIQGGNAPFQAGDVLPASTSFTWSDNNGMLRSFKTGPYVTTIPNKGVITISTDPVVLGQGFQQV